jgi:methionine-rich copper-binding protein CopC
MNSISRGRVFPQARRGLRQIGLIGGLLGLGAGAASSMEMMEQSPKLNETVEGSAITVALRFDQSIDHRRSWIKVIGPKGARIVQARLNAEPNTLYGALGRLAPGDYEVQWRASSVDGQLLSGSYHFRVQ